jgi:hypothetical protein
MLDNWQWMAWWFQPRKHVAKDNVFLNPYLTRTFGIHFTSKHVGLWDCGIKPQQMIWNWRVEHVINLRQFWVTTARNWGSKLHAACCQQLLHDHLQCFRSKRCSPSGMPRGSRGQGLNYSSAMHQTSPLSGPQGYTASWAGPTPGHRVCPDVPISSIHSVNFGVCVRYPLFSGVRRSRLGFKFCFRMLFQFFFRYFCKGKRTMYPCNIYIYK